MLDEAAHIVVGFDKVFRNQRFQMRACAQLGQGRTEKFRAEGFAKILMHHFYEFRGEIIDVVFKHADGQHGNTVTKGAAVFRTPDDAFLKHFIQQGRQLFGGKVDEKFAFQSLADGCQRNGAKRQTQGDLCLKRGKEIFQKVDFDAAFRRGIADRIPVQLNLQLPVDPIVVV